MLWFAGALAAILVIVGGAVFFTARAVLFDQVNDDLTSRAGREARPLADRLLRTRNPRDVPVGPAFTSGGYFYAVATPEGTLIGSTANSDPDGLAGEADIATAAAQGAKFVDTRSSEGEDLRVILVPVQGPRGRSYVLEVGRSTEPERQALRRLLLVLFAGGGGGLALAVGGGYLLAGRALRPIRAAMDRQQAFVADASHELRTPLALIRANAEVLQREADRPVQANIASVNDVISETDRLSGMVGQLLTLARADGKPQTISQKVDLSVIAADTVREMRLLAEPRQITIALEAGVAAWVRGDPSRLRELLTILLDNAMKYSDDGATARVAVTNSNHRAVLQVSDNGHGIPADALPRIFDRFYRVDKARSREMGGAGLGLSIAKLIAERHGGTIKIESVVGVGTTATVELPAS